MTGHRIKWKPEEAEKTARMVLALLEDLAAMPEIRGSDHLKPAEIHTVGPEAKVPYPSGQ